MSTVSRLGCADLASTCGRCEARNQSEPIVRLAGAVAGFVLDFLEGQPYAPKLYEKAIREGISMEI